MSAVLRASTIRQRFDVVLKAAGYERSAYTYDRFGRDFDSLRPGACSVGVPRSTFDAFDGRDRFGAEGEAATVIGIKTSHRLTTDDPHGTYDAALDAEQELITACLDADLGLMQVRLESADRAVTTDGGYLVSTVMFLVHHRFSFGR
jgi:hypothetical protein